jgi:hypothetical protein
MHPQGSNRQKRNLGLWSAAGVFVCGMVGAGIYLLLTAWMAWSVFRSNPTSIILTLVTI